VRPSPPAGLRRPLDPVVLRGRLVRLEPLAAEHVDGLVAASAEDPSLYAWSSVPVGRPAVRRYLDTALAGRDAGEMLPFATVRAADDRVVGSTRLCTVEWWAWPEGHPEHARSAPDAVEIGYTWLAASAVSSGINAEAKLLMLTYAFETWQVRRVTLKTDVRNARSRAAIERLGAVLEGIRPADMPGADGTVRDSAYYGIVADRWPTAGRR
jgi:RimJ/RimL family protein N-acetyltransferase